MEEVRWRPSHLAGVPDHVRAEQIAKAEERRQQRWTEFLKTRGQIKEETS